MTTRAPTRPAGDRLAGDAPRRTQAGDVLRLWALILLVSPTMELFFRLASGAVPAWLIAARILTLAAVLAAAASVRSLAQLRPFCAGYLLQLLVVGAVQLARASAVYSSIAAMGGFVASELFLASVVFVVIVPAILWSLSRRDRFFLKLGDLRASAWPLNLRWTLAAPAFAVTSALVAWLFVAYTGAAAVGAAAMAVAAVLLAAVNAFQEEFLNRNILVGALRPGFGAPQAVLVSAFIFGIGHWNGLPAGVLGVLMTFALGAVAGTAMVQTRGMFWSWFMHFIPDCVLFYYWGIGSVAHATIGSGHP